MHRQRLFFFVLLFGFLTAQLIIYSHKQPQILNGNGRGDDGVTYGKVADSFSSGNNPSGEAPFIYRIGVPWLASITSRITGTTVNESFRIIDIISLYVLVFLIYLLGLQFCDPVFAFLACIFYMLPFYGYVRLAYFYPILVDTPWMALIVLGLYLMSKEILSRISIAMLFIITFFATLIREIGILIPLTFIFSIYSVRRLFSLEVFLGLKPTPAMNDINYSGIKLLSIGLGLLFTSFAAIFLTREITTVTGNYSFVNAAFNSASTNTIWNLAMSSFLAFGGLTLSFLIIKSKIVTDHIRKFPSHLNFVFFIILLSLLGGANTVRFLSWASPLILILVFMCMQSMLSDIFFLKDKPIRAVFASFLIGVIITFQILSLHPFDGYYNNYTAWIRWGGLQYSPPSLFIFSRFFIITISFVFLWRWTIQSEHVK